MSWYVEICRLGKLGELQSQCGSFNNLIIDGRLSTENAKLTAWKLTRQEGGDGYKLYRAKNWLRLNVPIWVEYV